MNYKWGFRLSLSPTRWFAALMLLLSSAAHGTDVPNIAAASDLRFALAEVAGGFTRATGKQIRLTFGSSGALKTQIENGAPYQLFLSADEKFVFHLERNGRTRGESRLYAIGRLALFVPHAVSGEAKDDIRALASSLPRNRQIRRFAIANPQHAPYGRAARQALKEVGVWEAMQPKLVFGENASQSLQFVTSGASEGGIVPLALSQAPGLTSLGTFHVIPKEWHVDEPLHQRMALLKSAGGTAEAFFQYMQEEPARSILKRYGYGLPGVRH